VRHVDSIGYNRYPGRTAPSGVLSQVGAKMSKHEDRLLGVGEEDELESYIRRAGQDPEFRAAYEDAGERHRILDQLVGLRRHRRLSQSAVAARMGVRQPTVSGFETEDSDPRLSTLQRYARAVEARLRLFLVIPNECDWISAGATAYRAASAEGPAGAAVREGELAEAWRAERQQDHNKRWAMLA
jgi:transcriptional regulator with XRE-family HTH domain